MHLYMYSSYCKQVEVTLKDGCYPCIGDHVTKGQLEPAIWFKVLILDAISIVCHKRTILWHTSTDVSMATTDEPSSGHNRNYLEEDPEVHRNVSQMFKEGSRKLRHRHISDSMYTGGACLGYDNDVDEVFEMTQKTLASLAAGELTQTEFNRDILRLLHIHVLPKIRLSSDDVINVQNAMVQLEGYIYDMDGIISQQQNKIERVKTDMKKQRLRLVTDMNDPGFSGQTYSLPLSTLLQNQITDDVVKAREQLEQLMQKVEAAKEALMSSGESSLSSSSSSTTDNEDLNRRRLERNDFIAQHLNKLLTAKAVLDNYLSESRADTKSQSARKSRSSRSDLSKKRKKKERGNSYSPHLEANPLHATYMGMEQAQTDLGNCLQGDLDKKVLLISVKESMRGVLQQLECGEETSGIDIDSKGTRQPTDVLRHSQIPNEWLSLAEQVSNLIQDEDTSLSMEHQQFCQDIKEQCLSVLQKRQLSCLSTLISRESSAPLLSPTDNGGLYTENKLYSIIHSSDRSSGFSSCLSDSRTDDSNLSRSGNHDNVSPHSLSSLIPSPGMARAADFSSCEVVAISPSDYRSSESSVQSGYMASHEDSIDDTDNQKVTSPEETYVVLDKEEVCQLEATTNEVKIIIKDNIEKMCKHIQQSLGFEGTTYFRKIWQLYESHFYGETMDILSRLYNETFCTKTKQVLDNIPLLTASDLDLSGFILHLLQPSQEFSITSPQSSSITITASFSTVKDRDVVFVEQPEQACREDSDYSDHETCSKDLKNTLNFAKSDSFVDTVEHCEKDLENNSSHCVDGVEDCERDICPDGRVDDGSVDNGRVDGEQAETPESIHNDESVHGADVEPIDREMVSVLENIGNPQEEDHLSTSNNDCAKTTHTKVHHLPETSTTNIFLPSMDSHAQPKRSMSNYELGNANSKELNCNHGNAAVVAESQTLPPLSKLQLQLPNVAGQLSSSSLDSDLLEPHYGSIESGSSREQLSTTPSSSSDIELEAKISPRIIQIYQPSSTHVICDRSTWPLSPTTEPEYTALYPLTEDPTQVFPKTNYPLKAECKSTQFLKEHRQRFKTSFDLIGAALREDCPLHKLQQLVKCLKELSNQYQKLQKEFSINSMGPCTDELIDIIVLFLCNLQVRLLHKLYAEVCMLSDIMPEFFEGGPFSFTLVQFLAAFQVLQDRLFMKTRKMHTFESSA